MPRTFATALKENGLELKRHKTDILQINVGFACNLRCKHCHLCCGPERKEIMNRQTMDDVIAFAATNDFTVADITGGAPEMVPDLVYLIENLRLHVKSITLRSNLILLTRKEYRHVLQCVIDHKVGVIASFPSINKKQANSQRGDGVWQQTIENLQYLNSLGFGMPESDLQLILVSNPTGAFLPVDQCSAEKKFKTDLAQKWGIHFTSLLTFANVPLGRFKNWLEKSGNFDHYLQKLAESFNPATIGGLMCTSLISISWNGTVYDCDFNLAADLPHSSKPIYVGDLGNIAQGTAIATGSHCFSCTAGAGFT